MSVCISRHGEYSDHEPGDWCPLCGVFNEEAIVAERDALRETVRRVRERLDEYDEPGGHHIARSAARYIRAALEPGDSR